MIVRKPRVRWPGPGYSEHERFCFEARRDWGQSRPVAKFPTRTIVLMVLTLLSFGWFFWKVNSRPPPSMRIVPIEAVTKDGGTP